MTTKELAQIKPSPRQLAFQKIEFYGFIHFGMNTFTDREWGDGTDAPSTFAPLQDIDFAMWAQTFRDAGMKGMILTCKHHDGFCLWPSKYTTYSVAQSPWKKDVVAEAAAACAAYGLKFGVYLSPWDRHEPSYGTGEPYNQYFIRQLTELLTGYGDVFCVWLDGACGEGKNGKIQQYDWKAIETTVRSLQPNACINICGPDIRWCGNEAGVTRTSEWSVVPAVLTHAERTQAISQHEDDPSFSREYVSHMEDLGSRQTIAGVEDLVWYPAEVDTSIRPGWFYHIEEDDKVRSAEELFSIYCKTVGGNATLLLNVPPDRKGQIAQPDRTILHTLGGMIRRLTEYPIHSLATLCASVQAEGHPAAFACSNQDAQYWAAPEGVETACLEMTFPEIMDIRHVILGEAIQVGQRIESFRMESSTDGLSWEPYAEGTVIGYKKFIIKPLRAKALRLVITTSRWQPTLNCFQVFGRNPEI